MTSILPNWFTSQRNGWQLRRLKHIGQVISGTGFPHDFQGRTDRKVPFLKVSDMSLPGNETWIKNYSNTISEEGADELGARIIPAGSVVYAKIGAALLLNKRRLLTVPSCIDNNMSALVPKLVGPEWALRWMSTIDFGEHVNPGAVPSFTEGQQKELPFLVPPKEEEQLIINFLDKETTHIDALIREKERMLALLAEKRAALISQAVIRGLDPDVPLKPSGLDWLGDIPAHWVTIRLGYLLTLQDGMTPSKEKEEYWEGDIPWASPKDIKQNELTDTIDHVSQLAVMETGLTLISPPVLLLVVRGMILAKAVPTTITTVPVTINQDMKALHVNRNKISTEYLKMLFDGLQQVLLTLIEESAHGTRCFRTDLLKTFMAPIPPLDEQIEIVKTVGGDQTKSNLLIEALKESIALLKERRSALISAAVTGQIDSKEMAA